MVDNGMDIDAELDDFIREEEAISTEAPKVPLVVAPADPPAPRQALLIPALPLKPTRPAPKPPAITAEQAVAEMAGGGQQRRPITPIEQPSQQVAQFKVPLPVRPVVTFPAETSVVAIPQGRGARARHAIRRYARTRVQRHHWLGIADMVYSLARQEAEDTQQWRGRHRGKRGASHSPLPPPK